MFHLTVRDHVMVAHSLADPAFDALLTGPVAFEDLPATMAGVASGAIPALCHVVTYDPPA